MPGGRVQDMREIVIGGCAYRSQVHCQHAIAVAHFHRILGGGAAISYRHTSNLPQGRCLWLRDAINSAAALAVSVDSDTWFDAQPMLNELKRVPWDGDVAMAIAPVIRNGKTGPLLNIYHAPGDVFAPSACGGGRPYLHAGGFGIVAFNLEWFRQFWIAPVPEQFGEGEDLINQGEDIQFCVSVTKRGGKIVPMWVPNTHYDSSGGGVIGGASISYVNGRMVCVA